MRSASARKAEQLALKYHAFLLRYGGKDVKPGIRIKNARVGKIAGVYELIFTHGPYLAGVHEAMDKADAESPADRILRKPEGTPGKN